MKTILTKEFLERIAVPIRTAHEKFQASYPGVAAGQPIHTYYAPAQHFHAGLARELGNQALQALDEYAPDFISFAQAVGIAGAEELPDSIHARGLGETIANDPARAQRENPAAWRAYTVDTRMRERLLSEPVEDLRIDFEDGYGNRPDAEEDQHALRAAEQIALAAKDGLLPRSIGIRTKPFTEELRERSTRTMDILLSELAERMGSDFPPSFYINLAKVTVPEEVTAMAEVCDQIESALTLQRHTLRVEIMVETAQAILNEQGEVNPRRLVSAGKGRCVAAAFGTYDYTAGRGLAATYQDMLHPACDFAREVMQVSLAGTGIWLSDGGTNVLPVAPNRATAEGAPDLQLPQENREAVRRAWRLHFSHVRHSLESGFYQGWDVHPAQLATRYAAVYSFFLESFLTAAERLWSFLAKATQGAVSEDAATGQALFGYVQRAARCGAVTEEEAKQAAGLSADELRMNTLAEVLAGRQKQGLEGPELCVTEKNIFQDNGEM